MKKILSLALAAIMIIFVLASCDANMPKGDVYIPDTVDGTWTTRIDIGDLMNYASQWTLADMFEKIGYDGFFDFQFIFDDQQNTFTFQCTQASIDAFINDFTIAVWSYLFTDDGFEYLMGMPMADFCEEYGVNNVEEYFEQQGLTEESYGAQISEAFASTADAMSFKGYYKYEVSTIYIALNEEDLANYKELDYMKLDIKEQAFAVIESNDDGLSNLLVNRAFTKD